MLNTKNTQLLTFLVLSAIWIYTFYVSVVSPPFFSYYTVDENSVADSGVFLWYGITPRCLDWPATPTALIFFLIYGVDVLITLLSSIGTYDSLIGVFEKFDFAAYQYLINREPYILIARTIQLVVIGLFLFLTVRFIYRQNHPLLTPVVQACLSILIVTSYVVWFNAPVLRPEAISGCIFLYILVQLVFSSQVTAHRARELSILFAVVIAERLLFLFVSPIFYLSLFFLLPKQERWRVTLNSMGTTLLVFVALCPFLLTDPLVVAKSFVGGIIAKMNDKPMETLFNQEYIGSYFDNPTSYLIIILSSLGTYVLLRQKKIQYWVVVFNWLFFLFLVLRSAKIYDTHVLPAGVITLVMAGLGVGFVYQQSRKAGGVVSLVLVLVIAISNQWQYYTFQEGGHKRINVFSAYDWVQTLPTDSKLLVPIDFEFYLKKSGQALLRNQEQRKDTTLMVRKLNYLLGNKEGNEVNNAGLAVVAKSFAFEDEGLYDIQYQILLRYSDRKDVPKYDYDVYMDNVLLTSHSVEWEKSLQDFKAGKYKYLITDRAVDGYSPIKEFKGEEGSEMRVYQN
ncbi:hypothetical protein [Telluribacter sp. SYSU D00476]|uniref:hypothetical protein n=1 Tax=Telluribacter sp. SYSU D00476 TaxID=2811430 RepID=UPI001FF6897A|nr:hypothetical protein [Telluribacter sp. SYSU D00476]